MSSNEHYFYCLQGSWDWTTHFKIVSFKNLFLSTLSWYFKIQVVAMVLVQTIFGKFSMHTKVELKTGDSLVLHHLQIKKWRIVFYRSEKRIKLANDGFGISLCGEEFFWPFLNRPRPFKNYNGTVSESLISADYQWPLFGQQVLCKTLFNNYQGNIELNSKWLCAKFELTASSLIELKRRISNRI